MRHLRSAVPALLAGSALALGACGGNAPALDVAEVQITTSTIPDDGVCTHIVATRLGDFHVTEYQGRLANATLHVPTGETHVTATAYPNPCTSEPATAPWLAYDQTVTFANGMNQLTLVFHKNAAVGVGAEFEGDPQPLVVRPGTLTRIGRNGEDSAGPNLSLDAWEVKQIPLPPATGAETVLFSTRDKGLPDSPRGMAHLPDGRFLFQVSDTKQPLFVFDAAGNAAGTWPVSYPAGTVRFDITDGLDAIDNDHYVRTGWLDAAINCGADGTTGCQESGLDILTRKTAPDGSTYAEVTSQVIFPADQPIATEYPVGVTAVGARFAVTTLPVGGTRLVLVNADGTLAAGPTLIAGDVEGLFVDGSRIVGLDYQGLLTTYNSADLSVRSGETASFVEGINLTAPSRIAWRSAGSGNYVLLNGDDKLVSVTPGGDAVTPIAIDTSSYAGIGGVDYRADTDELLVIDRLPPVDAGGVRTPRVDFYSATTNALSRSVLLQTGQTGNTLRPQSVAWISSTKQLVSLIRRASGLADHSLDATVFVDNLDGTLAYSFDLQRYGLVRVQTVHYNAATDELVFVAVDDTATRILVTDRFGTARRSYRTDDVPQIIDLAPLASGADAGDFGVLQSQPSFLARVALP